MLELRGVEAGYGRGKTVLFGIDLSVAAGELALLMGHNGAGKTTLLRTVFGEIIPTAGTIAFRGEPLRGNSSERVRAGISYTAGGRAVFAGLTVNENLAVAASVVETNKQKIADRRAFVLDAFPGLQRCLDQVAGSMSGGQQRMLAVSMAVMQETNPRSGSHRSTWSGCIKVLPISVGGSGWRCSSSSKRSTPRCWQPITWRFCGWVRSSSAAGPKCWPIASDCGACCERRIRRRTFAACR